MMKSASLGRNVFSNLGGYVVSVLVAFLIAPITIQSLGQTRYGAWVLVSELIGYYGLLDLGIRGAVTYHVARYAAHSQEQETRKVISSAFWTLAGCGLVTMFVGIGLTGLFPYIFSSKGYNLVEVQKALFIMSALIAVSLPMNAFAGALIGMQRLDIASGVEVGNRVVTALFTYVVLKSGGGLVALALVQAAGRIFSWTLTVNANRAVLGGIFVAPRWFSAVTVRQLAGYGLRNAVGQVALLIIYRVDLTIVGIFAGMDKVTYYSIASTLVSYASTLCSNITYAFTPRFTHLQAGNNSDELNHLHLFGMRITGMVVAGLVAGIFAFGRDFIRLWLGDAYVNGAWSDRSDIVMAILILANLPRMLQSISWQRLYGTAHVRFLMWLNVCEAAFNLALSIVLAKRFGPAGVAMGTFFPLMVSQLLIMPIYSSRTFKIPLTYLLRKGLAIPAVTGVLMAAADLVCVRLVPPLTWTIFFCDVAVVGAFGVCVCLLIGFTPTERRAQIARFQWRQAV